MPNILHDFYNGLLSPDHKNLSENKEYQNALHKEDACLTALTSLLNENSAKKLEDFQDAVAETDGILEELAFENGFRLGGQFTFAILNNNMFNL